MTTTSESTIICTTCAALLPASEFRRRAKGSEVRMTKCRKCHAGYERVRRQKIQRKQNGLALQKAATKITRYRSFDRVENLIELMVSRFGGPAKFMDFWTAEIERIQTQKRVTVRILRFYEMLLSAHLVDSMSGTANVENSRAAALQMLRRLFQQRADLIETAAKQVGVTIVWATEVKAASS